MLLVCELCLLPQVLYATHVLTTAMHYIKCIGSTFLRQHFLKRVESFRQDGTSITF